MNMLSKWRNAVQLQIQSHSTCLLTQRQQLPLLLFYSSSSIPSENTTSLSNYLADSLGFSHQQCVSTCSRLVGRRQVTNFNPTDINNADSVVSFLKQQLGFNDSHIQILVSKYPRILFSNVDKTLKPKIHYLLNLGFSLPELAHLSSLHALIFSHNLEPAVQAFREVLGLESDRIIVSFIKKLVPYQLCTAPHLLISNVELVGKCGIPIHVIRKHIVRHPNSFLVSNSTMQAVLTKVEHEWGIPPTSGNFLYAVRVRASHSDYNINAKFQIFRRFGWTQSDVLTIVQRYPNILSASEARIKIMLEFLMNELGYKPAILTSYANLFTYSLKKRLLPRHRVLQLLVAKGLIKTDYKFYSATGMTESKFMAKFIHPFMEVVPNLLDVYSGTGISCVNEPTIGSVENLSQR